MRERKNHLALGVLLLAVAAATVCRGDPYDSPKYHVLYDSLAQAIVARECAIKPGDERVRSLRTGIITACGKLNTKLSWTDYKILCRKTEDDKLVVSVWGRGRDSRMIQMKIDDRDAHLREMTLWGGDYNLPAGITIEACTKVARYVKDHGGKLDLSLATDEWSRSQAMENRFADIRSSHFCATNFPTAALPEDLKDVFKSFRESCKIEDLAPETRLHKFLWSDLEQHTAIQIIKDYWNKDGAKQTK